MLKDVFHADLIIDQLMTEWILFIEEKMESGVLNANHANQNKLTQGKITLDQVVGKDGNAKSAFLSRGHFQQIDQLDARRELFANSNHPPSLGGFLGR